MTFTSWSKTASSSTSGRSWRAGAAEARWADQERPPLLQSQSCAGTTSRRSRRSGGGGRRRSVEKEEPEAVRPCQSSSESEIRWRRIEQLRGDDQEVGR